MCILLNQDLAWCFLFVIIIYTVTVKKMSRFGSIRQRCNGSGKFSINWLLGNVGNISVLNHEGHTKHTFAPGFAHVQTKRGVKVYARKHLNLSFHYKQKVKVKMEWRSDDGAFSIWCRLFSQRQRETNVAYIKSNQITFIVTSPQHKCLGEWNS